MNTADAEQPALAGLAPRKPNKPRKQPVRHPAADNPLAEVVLNVQPTHLGGTFDYLVDSRQAKDAQPGTLVRVPFGPRLLNGVIWKRKKTSQIPASALRYMERVIVAQPMVSASMREDISRIAKAYGGTEANIFRLTVPPRVAWVEKEQELAPSQPRLISEPGWVDSLVQAAGRVRRTLTSDYPHLPDLVEALDSEQFSAFLADLEPGPGKADLFAAWSLVTALLAGRSAIMVLPDSRAIKKLSRALQMLGLRPFSQQAGGRGGPGWTGDFAILDSYLGPAERYRAYLALATGQVRCAIGLRATMYAPVEGPALFAIMDDAAYQDADGMAPFANARGVLRLRAKAHGGVFLVMARARTVLSQWETGPDAVEVDSGVTGKISDLTADGLLHGSEGDLPVIRWLNREELSNLEDPTIGARVPHTAVTVIKKALEDGPVLLTIPEDGITQTLSCAHCHLRARCPRCTGPLQTAGTPALPRCGWCGAAITDWTCPHCGGERLRIVRVGAAGTADELRNLFRGVPILISSANQPRGPISEVDQSSRLVIATPGFEPAIVPQIKASRRPERSSEQDFSQPLPGYAAVAILDAWTSLYATGVDARIDTLGSWMRTASLCRPGSQGGQVMILGETDPQIAQALISWRSSLLAAAELNDRRATGLPPVCSLASVWGSRLAVHWALDNIGATTGDLATVQTEEGDLPAILGPVPISDPKDQSLGRIEGSQDRVQALVRVSADRRDLLAAKLKATLAEYMAKRGGEELQFQMDPKELI